METVSGPALDLSLDTQVSDFLLDAAPQRPCQSLNQVCGNFTRKFRKRSQQAIDREIERVRERIAALKTTPADELKMLLPMEVVAHQRLQARQQRQMTKLYNGLAVLQKETQFGHLSEQYDRLDMSFLGESTWSPQYNCKLPVFAAFDLQNATCTLTFQLQYLLRPQEYQAPKEHMSRSLQINPESVSEYFDYDGLAALAYRTLTEAVRKHPQPRPEFDGGSHINAFAHADLNAEASITVRADFAGAIPDDVREVIRKAQPQFDQILLIAETKEWSISTKTYVQPQPAMIPVGKDPLVVGRRDRSFWLLTAFDTTPAEDFVRREYRV